MLSIIESSPIKWVGRLPAMSAVQINAIRTAAIEDVETLAIVGVRMRENTAGIFDEFLAHVLGQIPLKRTREFEAQATCPGRAADGSEGRSDEERRLYGVAGGDLSHVTWRHNASYWEHTCPRCSALLVLDVDYNRDLVGLPERPLWAKGILPVTSRRLRSLDPFVTVQDSPDRERAAAIAQLPLNDVEKGMVLFTFSHSDQRLNAEAVAIKGTGREHSRWCPVTVSVVNGSERTLMVQSVGSMEASEIVKEAMIHVADSLTKLASLFVN